MWRSPSRTARHAFERRTGAPQGAHPLHFDVESGSAVAAMVGVALPPLLVGIELAVVVLRRRGDAVGRLDRDDLLARRLDGYRRRHRWLQQWSRGEWHRIHS